jgi:hypothetical protein
MLGLVDSATLTSAHLVEKLVPVESPSGGSRKTGSFDTRRSVFGSWSFSPYGIV